MKETFSTRHRSVLFGALLPLVGTLAPAQAPVGEYSARSRIDAIFAPFDRTDAPGCIVAVYRAGEILYTGGHGMADVAHHIPLRDTTGMSIASMAKQFTAFAVLLLEADGKIRLDATLLRYIPE